MDASTLDVSGHERRRRGLFSFFFYASGEFLAKPRAPHGNMGSFDSWHPAARDGHFAQDDKVVRVS